MEPVAFISTDSPTTKPLPQKVEERAGEVPEDSLPH